MKDTEGAFKKRWRAVGLTLAMTGAIVLAVALTPPARDAVAKSIRGLISATPAVQATNAVTLNGVTVRVDHLDRTPAGQVIHVSATDIGGASAASIGVRGLTGADYLASAGGSNGWDLRLPPSMKALIIDEITFREGGAATVELDIPSSGSISINRVLVIGRYPIWLTTGTWVDDGPNGHVFRIGFHTAPVAGRRLGGWIVDGVGSSIIEGPNAITGDGWLELMPNPDHSAPPGHATMSFTDPIVEVDGPWVLPLG